MINYSKKTYDAVAAADQGKLGVRLGAACIDAQIPVQVVAGWFGISRQGVYNWFTGKSGVATRHELKAQKIIGTIHAALDDKALPAANLVEAMQIIKQYKGK